MFRFRSCRVVPPFLLLAAFVCTGAAAELKKAPPTKEQVAQWIPDLGDDDFEKRENASKRLWEAARLAEAPLKEAFKSDDVEVKRRSQELLDKFKWGLYPDTPAKIVEKIQRYQGGADAGAKGAIVQELLDAGVDGRSAYAKISAAEDKDLLAMVQASAARIFFNRGIDWSHKKDNDHAIKDYDEAIRLDPKFSFPFNNRGVAWSEKKDYDRASKDYDEAIRLDFKLVSAINNKAWLLASCPVKRYRDGKKAVELATKACELTQWKVCQVFDILAAAYAETGDFDKAIEWEEKALKDEEYEKKYGNEARERLNLYQDKKPFRDK